MEKYDIKMHEISPLKCMKFHLIHLVVSHASLSIKVKYYDLLFRQGNQNLTVN